jgi:hypothetical protein
MLDQAQIAFQTDDEVRFPSPAPTRLIHSGTAELTQVPALCYRRTTTRVIDASEGNSSTGCSNGNGPQKFPNGAGNGWFSWDVNLIFWETHQAISMA